MARRIIAPKSAGPAVPEWVVRCVEAHWADPADDDHSLAKDFGVLLARRVLAHGRWSDARRTYAAAHGLTLRELGRPSFIGPGPLPERTNAP